MTKPIRPINSSLPNVVKLGFTPPMEDTVWEILAEVSTHPVLVSPNWDDVLDSYRPSLLPGEASVDGCRITLEQELDGQTVRPILLVSRAKIESGCYSIPLGLDAAASSGQSSTFSDSCGAPLSALFRITRRSKALARLRNTTRA